MIKLPKKRPGRATVVLTWAIAIAFCIVWLYALATLAAEAVS